MAIAAFIRCPWVAGRVATVRQAYAALVTVQVLFGLLPVAGKLAFAELSPVLLLVVRTAGAAVCLLILHRILVKRPVPISKEWTPLVVLALIGVVLNQGLFFMGLERTTPLNANLVITTIPVFTYAIAVVLGREQLGPRRAIGIGLALAGVLYLIGLSGFQLGRETAIGDLMVALNALCFAAFLVFSKPLTERYDPLSVTTWVFVLGALMLLPAGLVGGLPEAVPQVSAFTWLVVAFIILGPSVTTYALNSVALSKVPSSTVAVFIYLQPVVTAISAWLVFGHVPSWRLLPAVVMVFVGVYLVARRRPVILKGRVVGA